MWTISERKVFASNCFFFTTPIDIKLIMHKYDSLKLFLLSERFSFRKRSFSSDISFSLPSNEDIYWKFKTLQNVNLKVNYLWYLCFNGEGNNSLRAVNGLAKIDFEIPVPEMF